MEDSDKHVSEIEEKKKVEEVKKREDKKDSIIVGVITIITIVIFLWYHEEAFTNLRDAIFCTNTTEARLNNTFYNQYKFIDGCENDQLYCIVNIKGFDKSLHSYEKYKFNIMDFAEVKCIPECEEAFQPENQIFWQSYCSDSGSKSHQYLLFNRTMYEEEVRKRNEHFFNAGFCS